MTRPVLRLADALTPAELALQREAEARSLADQEARAIAADAASLLARCEQYARLNSTHPGFRHAVHELTCALRLKGPTLGAIIHAQDVT